MESPRVRRIDANTPNKAITTADIGSVVFVDSTDDDVAIPVFGPKGFDGADITFYKLVADNTVTLTPETGTINGASSYDLTAADACVTFTANSESDNWSISSTTAPEISPSLVIAAGDSLTYSPTPYAGTGSFQPIGPDLNLDSAAGSSTDPKYIGVIMGNVIGDALTKTKTYIGALIGKYSITGARQSTYPQAAVIGEVGDGVTTADAAVLAVLGGDSALTNARAAYTVDNQNSTPNSAFEYGLDLLGVDHDSYGLIEYSKAALRLNNDVVILVGSGAPVDGTTGDNFAGPGSLAIDYVTGNIYRQTSVKTAPVWEIVPNTTLAVNAQTDTTYTLLASDNGKVVTFSNGGGITVTVPAGLGAGFNCVCVQIGAGQVSFTASGTTINNRQSHGKIAGIYGEVSLVAIAANSFILAGDTAA